MTTAFSFSKAVTVLDIRPPAQSIGAHLAAKLQSFGTDERTLTDELCDMLCIWLVMQANGAAGATTGAPPFLLTLSKTTVMEEVKNGADLELIVSSPLGVKRCLMQAKVLDPVTQKLRCDSKSGWSKLRKQLVSARAEVGELAFLLIYVPGALLNGVTYGYETYEQGLSTGAVGAPEAFYGATLIPVDALLGPSGRWRNTKQKVPQHAAGVFKSGIPFWQLLLELLLCRRSTWRKDFGLRGDRRMPAFRTFSIGASEISPQGWEEIQRGADQLLRHPGNDRDVSGQH